MKPFVNKFSSLSFLLFVCLAFMTGCNKSPRYQTVAGDPMNVQAYTLGNGLKVFMSVNHEEPRIQTYIAVHTGSKNDPSETTGLAHYLEHLMFKGTSHFGTINYEAERPLLDTITALFEQYRQLSDPAERRAAYHVIDSISGVASQYAIPNEYDKMMALIGATGSNAYTSNDVTCYQENIPANQVENWARVQSDRFMHPVFRLFHTELEAVYEEKNISMTRDMNKAYERLSALLFPHHPYGTQTTIGTQEHLKNPSIVNIQNYFDHWYVPGNVAICLSGDFNPDQMLATIEKYFGGWQAREGNVNCPDQLSFEAEEAVAEPRGCDVLGQEAEAVMLGWRFEGAASAQSDTLNLVMGVLYNGKAGLMDLDLNQQKRVLYGAIECEQMADYSMVLAYGMPLPGQSLDEVRALLLQSLDKVAQGDFDEQLLSSVMTDRKLSFQRALESNEARGNMMVEAFINGEDWAQVVSRLDRMGKISKQDVCDFVRRNLHAGNYVYVNKLMGTDPDIQHIDKPEITPVQSNRDAKSDFLVEIESNKPADIEPVFLDYEQEIVKAQSANGLELLCKRNETNDLFELNYVYPMGRDADKYLSLLDGYSKYLGTSQMTPEEVQSAFYALGCTFSTGSTDRRFYIVVRGLNENLESALELVDQVLSDAQISDDLHQRFIQAELKDRADSKLSQGSNFNRLVTYCTFGPEYVRAHTFTNQELQAVTADQLLTRVHSLLTLQHRVAYYGPTSAEALSQLISVHHHVADPLAACPENVVYRMLETPGNRVFVAPYQANNTYLRQICNLGCGYDNQLKPVRTLYNEYFGGSMNAIVFQEMRETRGLAYNAWANLNRPANTNLCYNMHAHIITQNDKLPEAYTHFNEIINQMPESEGAFETAKSGILSQMRTERTTRMAVIDNYMDLVEEFGLTEDPTKTIFEGVQTLTLADLVAFQQQYIKDRHYNICVLGDPKQIDLDFLRRQGEVKMLKTEEIFGY